MGTDEVEDSQSLGKDFLNSVMRLNISLSQIFSVSSN